MIHLICLSANVGHHRDRYRRWPLAAVLLRLHLRQVLLQEEEEEGGQEGIERCSGPQECPNARGCLQRKGQFLKDLGPNQNKWFAEFIHSPAFVCKPC